MLNIATPTKGRARRIKTLELFEKTPVLLYLFVEPQEAEDYLQYGNRVAIIELQEDNQGIAYVRNAIRKFFGHQKFWMLDDDITGVFERAGRSPKTHRWLLNKSSITLAMQHSEELQRQENAAMVSLSFKKSNWLVEEDRKINGRCWAFCLIDGSQMLDYDENCPTFEDFDLCARLIAQGKKTVINYQFAFDCMKMAGNRGGLEKVYKDKKLLEEACLYLKRKYGEAVSIRTSKSHGIPEPVFLWSRFRQMSESPAGNLDPPSSGDVL